MYGSRHLIYCFSLREACLTHVRVALVAQKRRSNVILFEYRNDKEGRAHSGSGAQGITSEEASRPRSRAMHAVNDADFRVGANRVQEAIKREHSSVMQAPA